MKKIKKLKGTKITHFRYKSTVPIPDTEKVGRIISDFKLYFKNGNVLKLNAPNGLDVDVKKLQKLIKTKISEVTIKNDMVKILFKNNTKMKITTDMLWYKLI